MRQWQVRLQKSRSYKWWVLAVIMVGTFMAVLDVTVVNVGLPTIMNVFHIGLATAEWVVTAYMITMTIMLPTAGWLADRYGNKRIYVLGMILFTFGSWCCGRATVDEFLIFSRALQGVGSGIIQSLGLAIVSREFPAKQLSTALGLWAVAAAASISFGPLVGGFLVDDYSWHLIFDVNVPIGILGIAAALLIQKEWRNPDIGRFDWIGFMSVALSCHYHLRAGPGQCVGQPHGWTARDVVGRSSWRSSRWPSSSSASCGRITRCSTSACDRRLSASDARADYLRHRHVRWQLPAAALHAERSGLYGADGGHGFPAGRTFRVFCRPLGILTLCRRCRRVRRHRRDGAELFWPAGLRFTRPIPPSWPSLSAGIRHNRPSRR
ncbi:MAG: MFS transporter [Alistipes sp.]